MNNQPRFEVEVPPNDSQMSSAWTKWVVRLLIIAAAGLGWFYLLSVVRGWIS